jgi:hypothetical protein
MEGLKEGEPCAVPVDGKAAAGRRLEMARTNWTLVIGALSLLAPLGAPTSPRADDGWGYEDYQAGDVSVDMGVTAGVTMDTFRAPLAAHGQWVVSAGHGRVWRPWVAAGWRPYYYGRWEWTSEGWLWVSDEPFGWAVYHYGRWAWDASYGWVWVPGYQWAPAWVTWRYGADAIGWAPLAPGWSIYATSYPFYDYWWTFVPTVRFVGMPVYRVAYAPAYARGWYGSTAPAPPRAGPAPGRGHASPAWGGPAPRAIQDRTGRPVMPVRVQPTSSPRPAPPRGGVVPVYRPGAGAPDDRGHGRGPGVAPAPGRGGGYEPAPPSNGRGRGPGVAPAQGRGGWVEPAPPSNGQGRGPGRVAAPGRGGERSGSAAPAAPRGSSQAAPAPSGGGGSSAPPPSRGGGGGGGSGGGRGGERGERSRG